jgi:hypothetical protein
MPDLTVQVRDRDIIVSKPSDGLAITYRKDGFAPMLVAIDDIRDKLTPEELRFIPRAWKAAFEKAKSLKAVSTTPWSRKSPEPARRGANGGFSDIKSPGTT